MTIDTVLIIDSVNPVEMQTWLDAHPLVVINHIVFEDHKFYIFYV